MLEWADIQLMKQKWEITRGLLENIWFRTDRMLNALSTLQVDSKTEGYLNFNDIRDPTGLVFSERLAAGLDALITAENVKLFNLVSEIKRISDKDRDFLEDRTNVLRGHLALSNFHTLMTPMFKHAIDYATAGVYMAPVYGRKEIMNFTLLPAGSFYIRQNSSMDVDGVLCEYEVFYDEFRKKYPYAEVEGDFKPFHKINIVHFATVDYGEYYDIPFPPVDNAEEMLNWNVISCTFANNQKVAQRRLNYFPYGILRWHVNDLAMPWGINSPSQNATVQLDRLFNQTDDISCVSTFQSKPPIIGPSSLKDIFKGEYPKSGKVYYGEGFQKQNQKNENLFQAVVTPNLDISGLESERMRTDRNLERLYKLDYIEQFLSLEKSRTSKAEIDEKKAEKLTMMGSLMQRIQRDLLERVIKFGLIRMAETEGPEENRYVRSLEDFKVRPEFNTIIHQAQKALVAAQIERFLNTVSMYTRDGQNRDMDLSINKRELAVQYARANSISEKIIVNEKEFFKLKEQDRQREIELAKAKAEADRGRGQMNMAKADQLRSETELQEAI